MKPSEYFQAGQLDNAIAALNDLIKNNPTDIAHRSLLCEFLCFAGNLDRADKQLEAIGKQDAKTMIGVSLFRQLVRAEQARQDFFSQGRVPEFLQDGPTPTLKLCLEASIRVREGNVRQAADLLAQAEESRPKTAGTCNDKPFDDLRDLDDLTTGFFEILTSTGKYYWIPFERVTSVEFDAPERPRDLYWRKAHMVVENGPEGDVYLPVLYAGGGPVENDPQIQLGRATDWYGGEGSPVRGRGQKTFLVGDADIAILQLEHIEFTRE